MTTADSAPAAAMRTIRFHEYGEPAEVLRLEDAAVPAPPPGRVLVTVHAVGLNPADWALCRGLFPGTLPRGIGLDVSGTVDAVGAGVTGVAAGDHVFGSADFAGQPTAGAGDHAILDHWALMPDGLGFIAAAALPMAVVTAYSTLQVFGGTTGQTILIHGAGSVMGYAAVQIALPGCSRPPGAPTRAISPRWARRSPATARAWLSVSAPWPAVPSTSPWTPRRPVAPCPTWSPSRAATPAGS